MKVAGSMPDCRAPTAIVVIARTRDQRPETRNLSQEAPSGPISRIPFRRKRSRSFLWSRGYPRARAADPEAEPLTGSRDGRPLPPYLALLRMGFTVPPPLPAERCALTAPFHPCRPRGRRFDFCGTFLRVAATGGYPACRPCGVRTFLSGRRFARSDRVARSEPCSFYNDPPTPPVCR